MGGSFWSNPVFVFGVIIVMPFLWKLVDRVMGTNDKAADKDRADNRESHGVLHRKVEESERAWREKTEQLEQRLREVELQARDFQSGLKLLGEVPTRRELEAALKGIENDIHEIKESLNKRWPGSRGGSGTSGQYGAARPPIPREDPRG